MQGSWKQGQDAPSPVTGGGHLSFLDKEAGRWKSGPPAPCCKDLSPRGQVTQNSTSGTQAGKHSQRELAFVSAALHAGYRAHGRRSTAPSSSGRTTGVRAPCWLRRGTDGAEDRGQREGDWAETNEEKLDSVSLGKFLG